MKDTLNVGIIGAGVFAGYHSNKVAEHSRSRLTGIFDASEERASGLANRHDVEAFSDIQLLAEASDALIIATPASLHAHAAMIGAQAGCHLLVEKPISPNPIEADRIVKAMTTAGSVLQVGHQERVVMQAIGLDRIEARPSEIRIKRHMPQTPRNLDASVVMDLMVHDLDLLNMLFGTPDWISTEAASRTYSDQYDSVAAELGYDDFTAYVSASRDAEPERRWTLRYEGGTVDIDFAVKSLRHDTAFDLDPTFGAAPSVQDSLGAAWDRFVSACLDGTAPLVTGQDGLAAVRMAAEIEGSP